MADMYAPGGYVYLQRQLQRGSSYSSKILVVDTSGLGDPNKAKGAADDLVQLVRTIVQTRPSLILVDIDLTAEAGKPLSSAQSHAFRELDKVAQGGTPIVMGASRGIGRTQPGADKIAPHLRFGSTRALDSLTRHGFVSMYPVKLHVSSILGDSVEVPLAWESAAQALAAPLTPDPLPPVLVVTEAHGHGHDRTALVNFGAAPSVLGQAVEWERAATHDFSECIVLLGDMSEPIASDRAPVPGLERQSGILTLASIFHSRLERPLIFVPEHLEPIFAGAVGVGLIILRWLALFTVCKVKKDDPSSFSVSLKVETSLSLALIVTSFFFYTSLLPIAGLFVPGFVTSLTFALLEIPVAIFLHKAHHA